MGSLAIVGSHTALPKADSDKAAVMLFRQTARPPEAATKCDALTFHGTDPGRGGGPSLVAILLCRHPATMRTLVMGCCPAPLGLLVRAAAEDQAEVKALEKSASLGRCAGFVVRAVEEDQSATTPGPDPQELAIAENCPL